MSPPNTSRGRRQRSGNGKSSPTARVRQGMFIPSYPRRAETGSLPLEAQGEAEKRLALRHRVALNGDHAAPRAEKPSAAVDEGGIASRLEAQRNALAQEHLVADSQVQGGAHLRIAAAQSQIK